MYLKCNRMLPQLVGDLAGSQSAQAWWLGAMLVAYGLMQFQTENGSSYELIMAASCILVLPIVVVYLILRKYVIEGVTQSGIKG